MIYFREVYSSYSMYMNLNLPSTFVHDKLRNYNKEIKSPYRYSSLCQPKHNVQYLIFPIVTDSSFITAFSISDCKIFEFC